MNINMYPKLIKLYPLKRVLITGAGSGLGLALTKLLLNDGWVVGAIDINVKELTHFKCDTLSVFEADITDRNMLQQIIQNFCKENNGIDILFNNAGVGEGTLFKDYSLEHWDWIININLKAIINATYFVLPEMYKVNAGLIVNMASMAGIANFPRMSPYNVTKAALISLSETLNHELSHTAISVTCIMPTFFQSYIMQHSKGDVNIISSAHKTVKNSSLTSLDAAKIILHDLHLKKEIIRFPFSAHAFFYSRRFIPGLYKKVIRLFLFRKTT